MNTKLRGTEITVQISKLTEDYVLAKASKNLLFRCLTKETQKTLLKSGSLKYFEQGSILANQGSPNDVVHFVVKGLIISIFEGSDGTGIANAIRGPEAAYGAIGIVSTSIPLAQSVVTGRVVAQLATEAFIIPKDDFTEILIKSNDLLLATLYHAAEVIRGHELTLNCSRHHRIDSRLAYFLRLLEFYNGSPDLPITHAGLGEILGVRRESISTALAEYERKGSIQVNRGQISILDHQVLEYYSCECQSQLALLKLKQTPGFADVKNIYGSNL